MPFESVERLLRMDAAEIAWRGKAAARTAGQRAMSGLRTPRWNRRALRRRLASSPDLEAVRAALAAGDWDVAHRALSRRFSSGPARFVVHRSWAESLRREIRSRFPDAPRDAATRADRGLAGAHDLLGYRDLRFNRDWHADPVHGRRAPRLFWTSVPFLDPRCGDHKIVWEFNRHQHWLALGRAYWLSGDAKYRDGCLAELRSWLDDNPPLVGINWASMLELAFRSLSWLWALHLFADSAIDDATPWTVDLLLALDRQLTHVEQNLSYYFSPNTHLVGEGLALYVAGRVVPELAASGRRDAVGRRILVAEAARQIEPDGGYCERSTHYHRYMLDFYLLALAVARITGDPIAPVFERAAGGLAGAARLLSDDHGRLPHIGDDDGGMLLPLTGRAADDIADSLAIAGALTGSPDLAVGPAPEEAWWMLSHPRLRWHPRGGGQEQARHPSSAALERTGFYVCRSPGEHLVIDGGPHGYLNAGHAHADALSLTLSVHGAPLLVDPGTGCYTMDRRVRDRFRSSALHNTLVLDDRSQSLPKGPFHWLSTTDAVVHRWRSTSGFDYFDGSHHGYPSSEHRRRVLASHADLVIVADLVGGAARHVAAVHWHIAPGWTVEVRGRQATFTADGKRAALVVPRGEIATHVADEHTGLGWYSPAYGRIVAGTTLRIRHEGSAPFWLASVFDLNPADPIVDVEWMPIWAEAGAMAHGAALRIDRGHSTDYVLFAEPAPDVRATWRIADLETDARLLLCRVAATGEIRRVALVDGSIVRAGGRRALRLTLGRTTPSLFIDEPAIRRYMPCAASPGS